MKFAGSQIRICETPLWDVNLTLYSRYPDLTKCFQDLVLFILPCLYLLPTFPFYIWHLKKYGKTHTPYHISTLSLLKIVISALITGISLTEVILRFQNSGPDTVVLSSALSPILLLVSYVLVTYLLYYERTQGVWSSGYTFNFWLLCSCYLVMAIWSKSIGFKRLHRKDPIALTFFAIYLAQLILVLVQILLHSFNSKNSSGYDSNKCHFTKAPFEPRANFNGFNEKGTTEETLTLNDLQQKTENLKTCPEIYASFLSRVTFSWFDKLALYGSRHPLVRGDLWNLWEKNTSHRLAPLFSHQWNKYMTKLRDRRAAKAPLSLDNMRPEELLATLSPAENVLVDRLSSNGPLTDYTNEVTIKTVTGQTYAPPPSPTHRGSQSHRASDKGLNPSLAYVLYSCFKPLILQSIVYKFVNDMCTFLNPQLLSYIIGYIKAEPRQTIWVGIFYALAMLVSAIFHTLVLHQYFHAVFILGMRIKTILICAVYRKALRLSNSARKSSTVGEIVNLMSVDSQKIMDVCAYVSLLWSSPLQIFVCMFFLWAILGPSVLAGLLVMVLLIPLNGIIANKIKKLQTQQMRYKDERIKVMNEVLNGIKVLKLYAWEPSFEEKVLIIRNKEIEILKRIAFLNAITSFVWSCAPFTVSCVTFGTYVLLSPENILDASKAFVSLSLFNILRFPLSMLPMIITYVVEARVSLKRLCTFFMLDELDPDCVTKASLDPSDKNAEVITVTNGNFSWDSPDSEALPQPPTEKKSHSLRRRLHLIKRRKKHAPQPHPLTRKTSCIVGERGSKDDSFVISREVVLSKENLALGLGRASGNQKGSLPTVIPEEAAKIVHNSKDPDPHKLDDNESMVSDTNYDSDTGIVPRPNHRQVKPKLNGHFPLGAPPDPKKPKDGQNETVESGSEVGDDDVSNRGTGMDREQHRSVTLQNINLNVKRGELVAVVGTVGSGKSSLISALLGDMKKQNATVPNDPSVIEGRRDLVTQADTGPDDKGGAQLFTQSSPSTVNTSGYSSLKASNHGDQRRENNSEQEPLIGDNLPAATKGSRDPPHALSPPLPSSVVVRGRVAYVAQQPWIRNATLRNNVVFDAPFGDDVIEYEKVLWACALTQDRDYLLPDGDVTEIGEKGVTLSGGQKQRLSLARAVYRRRLTDVYLLDDPLSAVDVHVGRHLFDNVLGPNGLLQNKTRILVTNAIHILPSVDKILVMKNGTIAEQGTYADLSSRMEGVFSELLKNYLASRLEECDIENPNATTQDGSVTQPEGKTSITGLGHNTPTRLSRTNSKTSTGRRSLDAGGKQAPYPLLNPKIQASSHESILPNAPKISLTSIPLPLTPNVITKITEEDTSPTPLTTECGRNGMAPEGNGDKNAQGEARDGTTQLMTHETSETGRVQFSVYLTYFKAIKYHTLFIFLVLYLFYYALTVAANFWLSSWSDDQPIVVNGTAYQDIPLRNKRLQVYALYGGLQGVTIMASAIVIALSMVYASRSLHLTLLRNILHSPMAFFDTTPIGRIVNRFSKDMDTLDNSLPQNIKAWITTFYGVLSTILVISFSTPLFLAGVIPMAIVYFFILKFYIPTSRQLKRLESVSRSPIFSHFQETLLGSSTIRAFGVAEKFISESHRLVDQNQMCYYPSIVSNRWLAVRLEFIGSFIVFLSALTVVLNRDTIKPGLAGLAISYALSVTQALNWLVRMTCDMETNIVAVERVTEYSHTSVEAPWVIESHRPPADWPSEGNVDFEHYWLRYRPDLEPALKDVTFSVKGEQKVGVVGRTGAGKSSLTVALFRIVEPESVGGTQPRITIDGIDINTLGLHDIRSRLTIIPQDPVLFSGSLRFNLDPFNKNSEQEIWESLENAHLKNFVTSLPQGINHEIAESGENLSLGQRQLVCLARALLRKSKILVLDEATAAVDLETDELIQQTIREKFSHCTVITIAHRLNTVIDNTKILVLDHGRVAEYESPQILLRNRKSKFYKMCHEAGLAFNNNGPGTIAQPQITTTKP